MDVEADPVNKIKTSIIKKCLISKSIKFPYLTPLTYCQKLDVEAGPINKIKLLIIQTSFQFFPISKSIKFPYITPLKYCQELDFEADPINKNN